MGQRIAIDQQADVIPRRTIERLFRLQRGHEGRVRAIRTRLARGATLRSAGCMSKIPHRVIFSVQPAMQTAKCVQPARRKLTLKQQPNVPGCD